MSTQKETIKTTYTQELANTIDAIFGTKAYTEMKALYDNRQIEYEYFNEWLVQFTEKAFFTAEKFALELAMLDPNKDEKSKEELEKLKEEALLTKCQRETACIEKEILEEQRPINTKILENNRDKIARDIDMLDQQKINLVQEYAIRNERRVPEMTLLTRDAQNKQALYESEVARKLLLNRQKVGFDDNTIINFAQTANETIGMIQSGGNEAPATLWGQQATAMARLDAIAHR